MWPNFTNVGSISNYVTTSSPILASLSPHPRIHPHQTPLSSRPAAPPTISITRNQPLTLLLHQTSSNTTSTTINPRPSSSSSSSSTTAEIPENFCNNQSHPPLKRARRLTVMASTGREARRRRILQGGQDRLALITGRKPSLSSDANDSDSYQPFVPQQQFHQDLRSSLPSDQPSVSRTEEDKPSYFIHDQASNVSQNDALGGQSKEEPLLRKSEPVTEPPRVSASESSRREASSGVQRVFDTAIGVAQQIPISNVTSQQVSVAVAETEHDRLLCALTIAILVVLSSAGFPIVSNRLFRGILLFRPLFLVLITNITLIVWKLLPDNRKNVLRGDKDKTSVLGDGYAWAEDAGKALELGLTLKNLSGSLFMDCSVYATIVVFGLSLFG